MVTEKNCLCCASQLTKHKVSDHGGYDPNNDINVINGRYLKRHEDMIKKEIGARK